MGIVPDEAIIQFKALMDQVEEPLKRTYQNIHQGYQTETLMRFLKAREWNVAKTHKMKPIVPTDLYRAVRDSQLIGMSGYSREGLPVFAIGVGLSTFDKASVHYYVQSHIQINEYRDRIILPSASKKYGRPITTCVKVLDMTGLKLSALSQIKLLTIISTVDDLNYPEKTKTYYIVNAPYIFSACWKVVKPLLQERTRKKVQVLPGNGRDELLKIMDLTSLPHFCTKEGSGSSQHAENATESCYSLDHPFHQQLYNYIKQQSLINEPDKPIKQGSFHVDLPEAAAEGTKIAETIESELLKFENGNGISRSASSLKIIDD
ncbi:CRAL-TRIO domain-containing protein YKL091C isoform X2 [Hevea brasiliensis]|uniref:CRAL-TRIO domain-containing protein YKL091C isoform X2 n=1 Tax=Hevea brasiliensis TaxID=3981 RepID=UPI0025D9A356|nr:CRAL-TRIO domain-containing protein YKL091C isoform X2 [Hevea brasiliensis]